MKNSHLNPFEGGCYPENPSKVEIIKKVWTKPEVAEISRFSILGGADPNKTEGALTPIASV